jgi:hypothetical protein
MLDRWVDRPQANGIELAGAAMRRWRRARRRSMPGGAAGLSFRRHTRAQTLDILLQNRAVEAMDRDLTRALSRAKSLRQIPNKLSIRTRKSIDGARPR